MFFLLRKVVILGFVSFLAAGIYWVTREAKLIEPARDFARLWHESRGKRQDYLGHIQGDVIQIIDGATFQLRTPDRTLYTLRLAGIDLDAWREPRDRRGQARTNLAELISGRTVRADLTFTNAEKAGLAIVHVGTTNVNQRVLETGAARLNRQFIQKLPIHQQYQLFQAQQVAQEAHRGLWQK
jgi:endonuclease YncB( thermonuclease family)